jgi:hypothetical protein
VNIEALFTVIRRACRLAAVLLLLAIAVTALKLLMPGVPTTEYRETPLGQSGLPQLERIYQQPYSGAWGYLAFGITTALGLMRRNWLPLAWVGALGLAFSSSAWLFSSGAAILPLAVVVITLVLLVTWESPKPRP